MTNCPRLTTGQRTVVTVFDTHSHAVVSGPTLISRLIGNAIFASDNTTLYLSGGDAGIVTALSVADGRTVRELDAVDVLANPEPLSVTAGLAWVRGPLLAVGSPAGTVRLINPTSFSEVDRIDAPPGTTEVLTSFDDGRSLIGMGRQGTVRIDVPSSQVAWHAVGPSTNISAIATPCSVAEEAGRAYCPDSFGRVLERDLSSGSVIRSLDTQKGGAPSLSLTRNDTELIALGGQDPSISRWRLDGSGPLSKRIAPGYVPVEYSPDGSLLLVSKSTSENPGDREVNVISATDGHLVDDLPGFVGASFATNRRLVVDRDNQHGDFEADSYDLLTKTWTPTNLVIPGYHHVNWISESESTMWLEVVDDSNSATSAIWTFDKETMRRVEPSYQVARVGGGMAGTGDGALFAVATQEEKVEIFDGTTGRLRGEIRRSDQRGAESLSVLAFIDDHRLMVSDRRGNVVVYDVDSLQPIRTLTGAKGSFKNIDVSLSEPHVAIAAGEDHSVSLYNIDSGDQLGDAIAIPDDERTDSVLRRDGKEIAFGGSADNPMTFWDLDPAHWESAACTLAGRNLTSEEWRTYIGDLAPYHATCPQFPLPG